MLTEIEIKELKNYVKKTDVILLKWFTLHNPVTLAVLYRLVKF